MPRKKTGVFAEAIGKAMAKPSRVAAISPHEAQRELAALESLYEHTEISQEAYDAARARIFKALAVWGSK
jgi:hypothetical protein